MKYLAFILSLAVTSSIASSAEACTDFRLIASDGSVVITRSMEFALDLQGALRTQLRNKPFTTVAPDGKPGLAWQSKYGYVFIDSLNTDRVADGMNEKGLSFEALYLPGEAQYQTVPDGKDAAALPYLSLGDWILGNFQTVDEVRNALANVYVFEQTIPAAGDKIFPLHFSIFDATGKGIVVEYTKSGMQVYDNLIGVLTNSPTYDWHLTNLKNYVYLSPFSPLPITVSGMTFSSIGQGAGSIGLPGDISPPSRFVKMSFLKNYALRQGNIMGTLNLAEHIINNVDIPLGTVRARQPDGQDALEYTQWVVIKDLTHHMFYYRGYYDPTLRGISLDKLDFSNTAARLKMPINTEITIVDETSHFLEQKS